MADATVFLMENDNDDDIVNVGYGEDYTIMEYTEMIAEIIGFSGKVSTDPSKPDGTPKRLFDNTKLFNMGWKPKIDIKQGIASTYEWFKQNYT